MNLLIPALCFIKLSFLAFYKRIFCVHKSGAIQNGINAMMGLIVAWSVAYWFAHLFMCGTNFSAFWSSFEDLRMKCINTLQMLYSFTVTDFITDVFILVIPMPSVSGKRTVNGMVLRWLISASSGTFNFNQPRRLPSLSYLFWDLG